MVGVRSHSLYIDGPRGDVALLPKEIKLSVCKSSPTKKSDSAMLFTHVPIQPLNVSSTRAGWYLLTPADSQLVAALALRLHFDAAPRARVRMV
jgi:hypothetical protein